jgi:hypothetical protein
MYFIAVTVKRRNRHPAMRPKQGPARQAVLARAMLLGEARDHEHVDPTVSALSVWLALESPTTMPRRERHDGSRRAEVEGLPIAVERLPGRDGLGDSLILRAGLEQWRARSR